MEIDRLLEALAIAEAASEDLDLLNLRIHALGARVGDPMREERHDVGPVAAQHPRQLFDRLEPTANRPGVPSLEVPSGGARMDVLPERHQRFLQRPGPPSFQLRAADETDERAPGAEREAIRMAEPIVLRSGQP